jgi:hypothetical protein
MIDRFFTRVDPLHLGSREPGSRDRGDLSLSGLLRDLTPARRVSLRSWTASTHAPSVGLRTPSWDRPSRISECAARRRLWRLLAGAQWADELRVTDRQKSPNETGVRSFTLAAVLGVAIIVAGIAAGVGVHSPEVIGAACAGGVGAGAGGRSSSSAAQEVGYVPRRHSGRVPREQAKGRQRENHPGDTVRTVTRDEAIRVGFFALTNWHRPDHGPRCVCIEGEQLGAQSAAMVDALAAEGAGLTTTRDRAKGRRAPR